MCELRRLRIISCTCTRLRIKRISMNQLFLISKDIEAASFSAVSILQGIVSNDKIITLPGCCIQGTRAG